jgi:hypothetical protein
MKITSEISLENFEAWSGGADTMNELTAEELEQLESIIEDLYPDGMDETQLNDLLWFERDTIAEWLGYHDWEHLERAHKGIGDEDHVRELLSEKYPTAKDELIDGYIDDEWMGDEDDDEVCKDFEQYLMDNEEEEEDEE